MKFSSPLREEDQNSVRTGESTGHQSGFLEEQKEKEWGMEETLRKGATKGREDEKMSEERDILLGVTLESKL